MTCLITEISECVGEGTSITIGYTLSDENGDPITSVDKLEYKLSDGPNVLIDWTEIITPSVPSGSIKIPGIHNRIARMKDRFFTLHAKYNSGVDDSFSTVKYQIENSPNITAISP